MLCVWVCVCVCAIIIYVCSNCAKLQISASFSNLPMLFFYRFSVWFVYFVRFPPTFSMCMWLFYVCVVCVGVNCKSNCNYNCNRNCNRNRNCNCNCNCVSGNVNGMNVIGLHLHRPPTATCAANCHAPHTHTHTHAYAYAHGHGQGQSHGHGPQTPTTTTTAATTLAMAAAGPLATTTATSLPPQPQPLLLPSVAGASAAGPSFISCKCCIVHVSCSELCLNLIPSTYPILFRFNRSQSSFEHTLSFLACTSF